MRNMPASISGMSTFISVALEEITHAVVSLNFTIGFVGKRVPFIVTVSPNCADPGDTDSIFIDCWGGVGGVSFLHELKINGKARR